MKCQKALVEVLDSARRPLLNLVTNEFCAILGVVNYNAFFLALHSTINYF